MALKNLKYRFGTGAGGPNLEEGLVWLAEHDFHFTDFSPYKRRGGRVPARKYNCARAVGAATL
jgi:hypothetical protein